VWTSSPAALVRAARSVAVFREHLQDLSPYPRRRRGAARGGVVTVGDFAERLVLVALVVPFSVTSWGRSKKRNESREVQGHPDSWHLLWLGADAVLDNPVDGESFERQCGRLGLRVLNEGDHYHVQPAAKG
jgi:hypothetical protein